MLLHEVQRTINEGRSARLAKKLLYNKRCAHLTPTRDFPGSFMYLKID